MPLDALLDPAHTERRRALLGATSCGEMRPGRPKGEPGWFPAHLDTVSVPASWRDQLADGIPAVVKLAEANGDTCTITAVDRDGNMVSATPSGGLSRVRHPRRRPAGPVDAELPARPRRVRPRTTPWSPASGR